MSALLITLVAATVYVSVGLLISRWAWRSGGARRIADNIQDQPFTPGFVTAVIFAVWPIVMVLHFGGVAIRWVYRECPR
ncbi:hypothetical protein [Mycolicibacterium conceptionense]|uniref:Uncharacterized protein n=1 Tax=Mycolicibacterium conceptionense TaxID=451644 RepID=A0A1A2V8S0_9MYCO|nr:hypothetical protein [Mycolicibacterium conceptionense]OBF14417.1 hypothetical protein A5726_24980 [Mycolicibacterium conceptionense]OBF31691.1 hypothetical protein A5720_28065 [Mycolicibacterium conceptionense]OBH97035.1 hypothetical protein A5716_16860 [Mycolicibacterium conceptionense]